MPLQISKTPLELFYLTSAKASICHNCVRRIFQQKSFSTSQRHATRQRNLMFRWLNGPGAAFKDPLPGSTNYLNAYDQDGNLVRSRRAQRRGGDEGDAKSGSGLGNEGGGLADGAGSEGTGSSAEKELNYAGGKPLPRESQDDLVPFPLNRQFRSQPVLSEDIKDEIYKRVAEDGMSVRLVGAEMGVDMRRVGAVVRLKTVEKQWIDQGKPRAIPYARAVLSMLPQTTSLGAIGSNAHESINDLPFHQATKHQLFHPVSESRHFTRADAAKAFSQNLLPADSRVPHPELIEYARDVRGGFTDDERIKRNRERVRAMDADVARRKIEATARKEQAITKVRPLGGRWEFRFQEIDANAVRGNERSDHGIGARYGVPAQDRKRGQVKIPTSVPA